MSERSWPTFDERVAYQVWRFSARGRDLVIEGDRSECEALRHDLRVAEEGSREMARNFRQPRLDLSYELVERRTTKTILPAAPPS
jgi:hypothetical protein